MNLCTVKWTQCGKTIHRTVRTAHLSVLMTVHNDNTLSDLPK